MYKCLNCGNTEKFYGIAKEQGNALIFQNCGEFKGSDGASVLEEALNALRESHDRKKQPVGAALYPNTVSINTGPGQFNDPVALCEVSDEKCLPGHGGNSGADIPDPDTAIRGNLWAIQNDDRGQDVSWAYIISDRSWRGFHQVQSCAACNSTNIASI